VERDDRTPVGTFFTDATPVSGRVTTLGADAAHHARVKRLTIGDRVRLTDGAGHIASGLISGLHHASIDVSTDEVVAAQRPAEIHLRVPIADRDRMLWLAEKAAEFGVTSWQAIRFRRSMSVSPRGEGESFAKKVRARMINALEQSGGAWLPELLPDASPKELAPEAGDVRIVLDASGAPLLSIMGSDAAHHAPVITFGPEGGLETDELEMLAECGWRRVSLGETTLRFETAGVAAVAIVRALPWAR